MNIDTITIPNSVAYVLCAVVFLAMAFLAAKIAASTVNKRLYRMSTEMAKWQVWAAAFSLVLSFTTAWTWLPSWLSYGLAVGIVLMLLS